jgi:hypothetical protein
MNKLTAWMLAGSAFIFLGFSVALAAEVPPEHLPVPVERPAAATTVIPFESISAAASGHLTVPGSAATDIFTDRWTCSNMIGTTIIVVDADPNRRCSPLRVRFAPATRGPIIHQQPDSVSE